jgi:hypothetical protein
MAGVFVSSLPENDFYPLQVSFFAGRLTSACGFGGPPAAVTDAAEGLKDAMRGEEKPRTNRPKSRWAVPRLEVEGLGDRAEGVG